MVREKIKISKIEQDEVDKVDLQVFRVFTYWNNGMYYKFRGEVFSPQLLSRDVNSTGCEGESFSPLLSLFNKEDLK